MIIWLIALAKLLFHTYFNNRYGYFRDEFDYISCGDHLAWGYVDQPPLIPFLIHMNRAILGDSLRSIRFIPALASSLLVVQTAVIAREFGGRRFALLLSAIAVVIAPQYLSNGSLLGTNCLEPNLWMGCAYFAILAVKRAGTEKAHHCWFWFGVVAGVGMQEKYSIAVFGFGIVIGLLLTAQRPCVNSSATAAFKRYSLSIPSRALRTVMGSSRSPRKTSTPFGSAVDASCLRTKARTLAPRLASSMITCDPMRPVPPVTRIFIPNPP